MPTRQQKIELNKKDKDFQLLAEHGLSVLAVGNSISTDQQRYSLEEWLREELRTLSPYDLAEWLHAAYQLGQESVQQRQSASPSHGPSWQQLGQGVIQNREALRYTRDVLGLPAAVETLDYAGSRALKTTAPQILDSYAEQAAVPGKPLQELRGLVPRDVE